MRREQWFPPHFDPGTFGSFTSFRRPGLDQLSFEFSKIAQDCKHQPSGWRCGVRPRVRQRFEQATAVSNLLHEGQQVDCRPPKPVLGKCEIAGGSEYIFNRQRGETLSTSVNGRMLDRATRKQTSNRAIASAALARERPTKLIFRQFAVEARQHLRADARQHGQPITTSD